MKYVLWGAGALLLLIIVAVIALPSLVPPERLEQEIETRASEALGRTVTVDGAPSLSVIPTRVSVNGLTVGNPDGFTSPHFVSVGEATVGLKLLPLLLSGGNRIEITQFTLIEPDIRLEQRADGSANWELTTGEPAADQPAEEAGALPDLRLGTVEIVDGLVVFSPAEGEPYRLEDADITLGLPSLDDPLTARGTFLFDGEEAMFDARLETPRQFAETGGGELALNFEVAQNTAETTLTIADPLAFDGTVDIDFPALRDLLALAGTQIDTPNGFNRLRLSGPISGTTERFSFGEGTELAFDDIRGAGAMTLDLAGARPKVSGRFDLATLDTRPYLPPSTPDAGEGEPFPAWSDEAMDFSALRTVDADVTVTTEGLILPDVTVGPSALTLTLTDGDLRTELSRMALYEGSGSGVLTFNARQAAPRLGADFSLSGVNVGALAQDLIDLNRLAGTGDVSLNITTQGASQAAMVRNLNGAAEIDLADGTMTGVNLGKIVRGVATTYTSLREGGFNAATLTQTFTSLTANAQGSAEATDFSNLDIDLAINNGVVTSNTFQLAGPAYRLTGEARVDLPAQTMRMRITPAYVSQEGGSPAALPTPLLVSGDFNSPKIGVDAAPLARELASGEARRLLQNQGIDVPEGATIEDALRNRAQDEIRNLIRPRTEQPPAASEDGAAPAEEEAEEARPEDALIDAGLNALFGNRNRPSQPSQTPPADGSDTE